jgi:hypothetical protein
VYFGLSKRNFFQKWRICKFIVENGCAPLNGFLLFDYYLADTVDHEAVRLANHCVVKKCDELWSFGEISDGVEEEINTAKKLNIPVRYFDISKLPEKIIELSEDEVKFEKSD